MVEEWQNGAMLLLMVGMALASGAIGGGLLWAFVVVLPAELLFDAVWLEDYFLHAGVAGAGTVGVRTVGRMARLNV